MVEKPIILVRTPADSVEQDCACPNVDALPMVSPRHASQQWQVAPSLVRLRLPDDYELAFNPTGHAGVVVLNQAAWSVLDSFDTPHPLDALPDSDGCAAAERLAELALLVSPQAAPPAPMTDRTLTAWLHVTNACNLRCHYCYVAKTQETMDSDTGRAAVDAIFRSALHHGFKAVKLKYAGGESTLNFALVAELHAYAYGRAQATGLELREVVLTNGVALPDTKLAFLRDANIRLMISLDGIQDTHDAQRVFAGGQGSFRLVERTITRAINAQLIPHLSITVTSRSAGHLAEAVAFALDRDLPFHLNFYRQNDHSAVFTDLAVEHEHMITGMRAAFAVIRERLPQRSLIDGLVDHGSFQSPHDRACGAGHNYMVIDQNGRIARCQMEIERPVTTVAADDPLHIIRLEKTGFSNLSVTEKEGCRTCEWRFWCAGGCSLLTYRATGRSDVQSPYCSVYKAIYPDVLRLEGLRLMRWGQPVV